MKKAAIIGATGFGGMGLIDILRRHQGFEITALAARKEAGVSIDAVFPFLQGHLELPISTVEEIDPASVDVAFFSTPDRAGMSLVRPFVDAGVPVIDFSGDFRFTSEKDYAEYAAGKNLDAHHLTPELLDTTTYGLPERNRKDIPSSRLIGNPGCFAISMILALLPLAEEGLLDDAVIHCDGKTGVSGAGRFSGEANSVPQRSENVNTYREGTHQHIVEVEQIIEKAAGKRRQIFFVPQVVPMSRGILNNLYLSPAREVTQKDLTELFIERYRKEPFVQVRDTSVNTSHVRGSNNCLIRPHLDQRTGTVLVSSAIDNLLKGQSGNAVQVANILFGYDEKEGLQEYPFFP